MKLTRNIKKWLQAQCIACLEIENARLRDELESLRAEQTRLESDLFLGMLEALEKAAAGMEECGAEEYGKDESPASWERYMEGITKH